MSALGVIGSSSTLSWPHGTEFADSFLKLTVFSNLSFWSSCDNPNLSYPLGNVPFAMLQRLADADYRKSMISGRMRCELQALSSTTFCGIRANIQTLSHTVFESIRTEEFDELVPAAFILVWFKYNHPQWIYPHMARLSIDWRKQRSSGHMFLCLDLVVSQRFFMLSPAKSRWRGTVDFINLGMGKSRLYGIGSLMWTSGISISSKLSIMQQQ